MTELGQDRVAGGEILDARPFQVEMLVLKSVRVLVGHGQLVNRPERAVALDDVEAARVGSVVGRDLPAV